MKILVTGAHFTPAVATIEQLKKFDDAEIVYVGRKNTLEGDRTQSIESKALTSLGIRFIPIVTGRLQRSFTIHTIPSLFKIPIGLVLSVLILLKERPDVILSFGGYVALPLVMVGWFFSIPIIIHEQGLVPGLTNRISYFFADKVAISFDNGGFKGKKVVLTGNPIRSDVFGKKSKKDQKDIFILITGGNQGSHIINLAVEGSLGELTKKASLIHVTGDNKFGDFSRLKALESNHYLVEKWIGKDWGDVLSTANLVISRAGINTLTELAFLGKPMLLIPIPNKEQQANAKYFKSLGFAEVLPQPELNAKTLLQKVSLIIENLSSLKQKAQRAKKLIAPDAAKRLALETILLRVNKNAEERL